MGISFRARAMNARYGFRQRERDWYDAGGQMREQRAIRAFMDHMAHGAGRVRGFKALFTNHGEVHPMFFRDPREN